MGDKFNFGLETKRRAGADDETDIGYSIGHRISLFHG